MKAWFVSDIHLKSLNERNGNILLRFLLSLADGQQEITHLFLLGDIFDFWVGDHDFYLQKFRPIVEAMSRLVKQGVKVVYVEGNHDVHVKNFWTDQGMESFVEDRYFDLLPWTVRVSHGDLMNPGDHDYAKYRSFIRQSFMEKVAEILPAKQLYRLGDWASQVSRKKSSHYRRDSEEALRNMIHTYAQKSFSERAFDFIITGHMHFRDEWSFLQANKNVVSINLGSWFDQPQALVLDGAGYHWEKLD